MNPGSTCFRLAFSMTGLDTGVWLHILCKAKKKKKKKYIYICVFPVSRPTLIFRATLNILLHF